MSREALLLCLSPLCPATFPSSGWVLLTPIPSEAPPSQRARWASTVSCLMQFLARYVKQTSLSGAYTRTKRLTRRARTRLHRLNVPAAVVTTSDPLLVPVRPSGTCHTYRVAPRTVEARNLGGKGEATSVAPGVLGGS